MELFNDQYWTLTFNKTRKIFETVWTEQATLMSDDEFKQHIVDFAEMVKQHKPIGFIADSRNGHFTMSTEIHTWHDNEIVPIYISSGLKKIAFIQPPDIFAAVSLEQVFEEKQAKILNVRHFDNPDEAMSWITEI